MTVRPSAWKDLAATERISVKFVILQLFEILSTKIEFELKYDKNIGQITCRRKNIYDNISLGSS
jgi:hypothetical protein